MDQAFGRLPPGKKLCLADILRINSTQHYNLDLTLSEAAYQTPGNEARTNYDLGQNFVTCHTQGTYDRKPTVIDSLLEGRQILLKPEAARVRVISPRHASQTSHPSIVVQHGL